MRNVLMRSLKALLGDRAGCSRCPGTRSSRWFPIISVLALSPTRTTRAFSSSPEAPMHRFMAVLFFVAVPSLAVAQDIEPYEEELATFSIIARDPETGQLGEVMTSKALAGGNRAVTAKGGVAIIAHQQSAN